MKKLSLLLLFASLSFFSYSQEYSSTGESTINLSWQKLDLSLSELERTLLRLQNDNALLTETLSEQEKLLSDSRQASAAALEQYRKSELALQKSERTLKCWRTACGITIGITVPTIVVLVVFLAK